MRGRLQPYRDKTTQTLPLEVSCSVNQKVASIDEQPAEKVIPPNPNVGGIVITKHAMDRFRERSMSSRTDEQIKFRLLCMLAKSKETQFIKGFRNTVAILNHHGPARYFRRGSWILVVADQEMKTCYEDQSHRFQ